MRIFIFLFLVFIVSCSEKKEETAGQYFENGEWVDLTYAFSSSSIYWPTAEQFRFDTAFEGTTPAGFYYSAFNFCAAEHGGTHLDAPVHFAKGKWSSDEIPLVKLTGNAVVIDVSDSALNNPDYLISVSDVENWEQTNGKLEEDIILLFRTDYGKYYTDIKKYLGTDERGAAAISKLHFPGLDPVLAEWLVKNRKIKAVGVDVASVDYGQSTNFKTHRVLYEQNISGFENVANLDKLPTKGAYIIALPMKIKGGSGGPLRIIAWVNRK